MGKISFSLYLIHYPLLFATCGVNVYAVRHHAPELGFIFAMTAFFTSSIALSCLMYYFVEKPTIYLSREFGSKMDGLIHTTPFTDVHATSWNQEVENGSPRKISEGIHSLK